MSEKQAFVALGANLGEPVAALKRALAAIAEIEGTRVVRASSFYSTAPIDSSGPDYVNAVCEVSTTLQPQALLHALQRIENDNGRVRPVGVHNAPRTLDLDVLLFDGQRIQTPELTVPHPRMHLRAFVLVPLVEIAPEVEIPGLGKARDYLDSVANQEISKL